LKVNKGTNSPIMIKSWLNTWSKPTLLFLFMEPSKWVYSTTIR
jgi:hypothetical protein